MRERLLIILFSIILFACSSKTPKELEKKIFEVDSSSAVSEVIIEKKPEQFTKEKCNCYKGIGSSENSKPIFTFDFSNGKSVSVCGYAHENMDIISEFNVFDCATGESFVEFGAVEECRIKADNDTIEIQLLKILPIGDNWKWEPAQIGIQTITTNSNKIEVSSLRVKYKINKIDNKLQTDFLNSLHKGEVSTEEWENILGKLEVLSLNGNKQAWEILKEFDDYINSRSKPDGALAEEWKDALATVRWVTENN